MTRETPDPWRDPETLYRLYHGEGLTQKEIGNRLGCTSETISQWMQKHGIPSRQVLKSEIMDVEDRFLQFVQRGDGGECWEWTGALTTDGYPLFTYGDEQYHAARASYEMATGEELTDSEWLHRDCGNRRCVNPAHLSVVPRGVINPGGRL